MSCKCLKTCRDVNEEVDFGNTEYLRSKTGNFKINNDPRNIASLQKIKNIPTDKTSDKNLIKNNNITNNDNEIKIKDTLQNQIIKEEDEEEENKSIGTNNNRETVNTLINKNDKNKNENKSDIDALGKSIDKENNENNDKSINSEKSKNNSFGSVQILDNFDKEFFFTKILKKAEKNFEQPMNYEKDWEQYCDDSDNEDVYLFINSMNNSKAENNINHEGHVIEYKGEKYLYKGELDKNKRPMGFGALYTEKGEKYEGNFNKGKLFGLGRYINEEGTCYEGIFNKNKIISKAKIIKFNENGKKITYFGEISDLKKNGKGQEESEEFKYTGEFFQDLRHGHGLLEFLENGDIYEGDFNMGEMTGKGIYIWKNKQIYDGDFVKSIKHGKGKYKWPDGYEYEGDYNNGIREGNGIYKWKDGRIYKGQFKDGKPHGKGILTYKGKSFNIEYINGKPNKDIKELLHENEKDI